MITSAFAGYLWLAVLALVVTGLILIWNGLKLKRLRLRVAGEMMLVISSVFTSVANFVWGGSELIAIVYSVVAAVFIAALLKLAWERSHPRLAPTQPMAKVD